MSTHIDGLRDPDSELHKSMVNAARALIDAGVSQMPPAMQEYFKLTDPSEVDSDSMAGCTVSIEDAISNESSREMHEDYIVDLRKLPEGVTHIRFSNSW